MGLRVVRRRVQLTLSVALIVLLSTSNALAQSAPEPPGSEPPVGADCDQDASEDRCDVVRDPDQGTPTVTDEGPSVYTQVWGTGYVLDGECEGDPPRPRVMQWLEWGYGPEGETRVHGDDLGEIIGRPDQAPLTPEDAVIGPDGFVYRIVCVDVSITVDVWEEVERRRSEPGFDKDPMIQGLTGLDTWVWYQADPQVQPFGLDWVDPETGVTVQLEAWAWITDFTWTFGDGGTATTNAPLYERAPDAAGSHDTPAGVHVYETTSSQAGFPDGYPVSTEVTWVGEWRWRTGDDWSTPIPMATTITTAFNTTYPVIQIRSVLE